MNPPWPIVGYLAGLCLGAWLGSFAGDGWRIVFGSAFGLVGFLVVAKLTGTRP